MNALADVNFLDYGVNAERVLDTGVDITKFASENGEVLGVFLAFLFIMFFVGLILIFFFKIIPKLITHKY